MSDGGSATGFALGSLACVCLGAIMSGLQVGYFSLDPMKLQLLQMDPEADTLDKKRATQLLPLLSKHHLLLVTLLICNAAAMETLPILLDNLVPSYVAIIMSVTLVLICGEIIPQALCTSRPLQIGSFFAPMVRLLMFVTYPVSWPIAKLLDYIIGRTDAHHLLFKRTELHALVDMHSERQGGHLQAEEVKIMKGAMAFSERPVYEIMTPLSKTYMIELHRCLDFTLFNEVFKSGFSRIPVYDNTLPSTDNIIGLLIVKDLILLDPSEETPVATILQFYPHPLEKVFYDSHLKELLLIMKSGRAHMVIVHDINNSGTGDPFRVNMGIVTLEDVIESILQMEIEDESDLNSTEIDEMLATKMVAGSLRTASGRALFADRYMRRSLPQQLTPNELVAVQHHLIEHVDLFAPYSRKLCEENIQQLLLEGIVKDVKIKHNGGQGSSSQPSTLIVSPLHAQTAESTLLPSAPDTPKSPRSTQKLESATPTPAAGTNIAASHAVDLSIVDVFQGGWSLYRRGEASEWFTVIIDGSVQIKAGVDEFIVETGGWSVLGAQALKSLEAWSQKRRKEKGTISTTDHPLVVLPPFIPDFSASLTSHSRILRISRKSYLKMLRKEAGLSDVDREELKEVKEIRMQKGKDRLTQQRRNVNHTPNISVSNINTNNNTNSVPNDPNSTTGQDHPNSARPAPLRVIPPLLTHQSEPQIHSAKNAKTDNTPTGLIPPPPLANNVVTNTNNTNRRDTTLNVETHTSTANNNNSHNDSRQQEESLPEEVDYEEEEEKDWQLRLMGKGHRWSSLEGSIDSTNHQQRQQEQHGDEGHRMVNMGSQTPEIVIDDMRNRSSSIDEDKRPLTH